MLYENKYFHNVNTWIGRCVGITRAFATINAILWLINVGTNEYNTAIQSYIHTKFKATFRNLILTRFCIWLNNIADISTCLLSH